MSTWTIDRWRSSRLSLAATVLALLFLLQSAGASVLSSIPATRVPVSVDSALKDLKEGLARIIVQKWSNNDRAPERGIERLGGKVVRDLPIIDGFSAVVPAGSISSLDELQGARVVSLDGRVRVEAADTSSTALKSVYPNVVRADAMWKAGFTGKGVGVAILDTGIADVPDLAGRVLPIYDDIHKTWSPCVNLSGEPGCSDSYGHGTFIAGIVAGNGASSGGAWKGVAPEANLVSIKIAGRDGSADVSTIIAGIQWTVTFEGRYNIRVLNLSLGTDSTQTYRTDPLNYAVERAWDSGIAVVVSASNRGPDARTISKPGDDPWVITVGALDDRGTNGFGDDQLPNFSSRGPTASDGLPKPDITAPGAHMISLRAPGSEVDTRFPSYVDGWYRKGSGTSMSAGVVSGAASLMIQADPNISPDRLKFALTSTARKTASNDAMAVGSGVIDAYAAATQAPPGYANQGQAHSNGLGSLDASRGTVKVSASDPLGTVVSGTLTAQLLLWDPIALTGSSWYGSSWYGSSWYGSSWYGVPEWYGSSWYGSSWYGSSWYGSSWYGSSWYGSSWYGSSWYGSSWYGTPDGSSWYGSSWYGSSWYGAWE